VKQGSFHLVLLGWVAAIDELAALNLLVIRPRKLQMRSLEDA